jgi:hypothetical protein
MDLTFDASYIFVTGALQIGTEADPFLQRAVVTLHGSPVSAEIPLYGAKNIGCRGCTLDLHGAPVARTWTYLARTAERMHSQLRLTEAVDWEVGSQIVVTSTAASGSMEEAEQHQVAGLSNGGTTVHLVRPMEHAHLGETRHLEDGTPIPLRANVGLLSRNVVVQGASPLSQADQYGVHILLHSKGDESLVGRIENIEARNARASTPVATISS